MNDIALENDLLSHVRGFKRACHIKLGQGGNLAERCIKENKLCIGYFTGASTLPTLLQRGENKWDEIRTQLDRDRTYPHEASLTAAINQARTVVDDDGGTLWFTFHGSKMYWTFIDPAVPLQLWDEREGTYRQTIGWRCIDMKGRQIDEGQVTTRISQVRAYQRTVRIYTDKEDDAEVKFNPVEYLRNRILGMPQPSEIEARSAQNALESVAQQLIVRLTDKEFENFVDLIFVGDGWQRVTEVGGQMADIDGQYEHATSGATAKVQCKSSISMSRLDDNSMMSDAAESDTWIFWAYHTADTNFERDIAARYGDAIQGKDLSWYPFPNKNSRGRFYLLNRGELAELAVRKGLIGWLRHKAC